MDKEAAAKAIEEQIAKPLGLNLETSAFGIYELVTENMVIVMVKIVFTRFNKVRYGAKGNAADAFISNLAEPMLN